MDTKSKNFLYSLPAKLLSNFIILILAAELIFNLAKIAMESDWVLHDSYYATSSFQWMFSELSLDVVREHITLVSQDNILSDEDLTPDEQITRLENLRFAKENLESNPSLIYVIENNDTKEVVTNLSQSEPLEYILTVPTVVQMNSKGIYFPGDSQMDSYGFRDYYNNGYTGLLYDDSMYRDSYEVYVAIDESLLRENDWFYSKMKDFVKFQEDKPFYIANGSISLAIALLLLIHLTLTAGKRGRKELPIPVGYDRIPLEIQLFITWFFCLPFIYFVRSSIGLSPDREENLFFFILCSVIAVATLGFLILYQSVIRLFKSKMLLKNSLCYQIPRFFLMGLHKLLVTRVFKAWLLLAMILYIFMNFVIAIIIVQSPVVFLFLFTGINLLALLYLRKHLTSLQKIMDTVKEWSVGKTDIQLNEGVMPIGFQSFTSDLKSLQDGLQIALNEAVKGEKLKTELITNVTHDLKNPLTSVINYVDLLQNTNLSDEQRTQYLEILEEKSKRLKILIEQLVEAAKVSSGNLTLQIEKIDLYQLIQQLLGEFESGIENAQLQFVMEDIKEPIYAHSDNRHLWRVFENLISNVVKYSMKGTRVYIAFGISEKFVRISIKNISAVPLNIPVSELTERFVRGDQARNSEGSGLGLSIADDLMRILQGKLELSIEGDMFKAIVELKKDHTNIKE